MNETKVLVDELAPVWPEVFDMTPEDVSKGFKMFGLRVNGLGPEKVYEAVDATNEENYYPIGMFRSLEEAVSAVMGDEEPWTLCQNAMYDGDEAKIEIREREFGLHQLDIGKLVWAKRWARIYDSDTDNLEMVEVDA